VADNVTGVPAHTGPDEEEVIVPVGKELTVTVFARKLLQPVIVFVPVR
jgi:hypothetical protein